MPLCFWGDAMADPQEQRTSYSTDIAHVYSELENWIDRAPEQHSEALSIGPRPVQIAQFKLMAPRAPIADRHSLALPLTTSTRRARCDSRPARKPIYGFCRLSTGRISWLRTPRPRLLEPRTCPSLGRSAQFAKALPIRPGGRSSRQPCPHSPSAASACP
jgi:hypothetical protein